MSAKRKVIAPDFQAILGAGSDVKMDAAAVGTTQPAAEDTAVQTPEDTAVQTPEASPSPAVKDQAQSTAPATAPAASGEERADSPSPQRGGKPKPVYDYERIESGDSRIEESWIQANVKMHPGVRTSYSAAVKVLKQSGRAITGRRFVHEAMNAKFLTMAPFNEYTQRLHDEAETEYARKAEDRPGESAEQWRPPLRG
jgi:hypothetical protein